MHSKKRVSHRHVISFFAPGRKIGRRHKKSPSCVHVADRTSEPTLTPMGRSFDDTKLDPSDRQALTGIKTALRRLGVNLGHPTNDDLTRCLAAGGGTRVAEEAVKCMRLSIWEKMSRPRSHRPSRTPTDGERFNERLFVDVCDVVDVRGNRYWWLVAVGQNTDYTDCPPCQPRGKKKNQTLDSVGRTPRHIGVRRGAGHRSIGDFFLQKHFRCQGLRCKAQQLILRVRNVETSKGSPPSRKWRATRFLQRRAMSVVSGEVARAESKSREVWAYPSHTGVSVSE